MNETHIYTDGGCHGNPGPGGWAYVVVRGSAVSERNGNDRATTNNRMELGAVIEALKDLEKTGAQPPVVVHTDSQYVKNGITVWIHNWVKNGWQTSARKPVKNKDLWVELHEVSNRVRPQWEWVRGHSGDPLNERCDQLVQEAIARIER